MKHLLWVALLLVLPHASTWAAPQPPYPHSPVIEDIKWQWETYTNGAIGSDLWPVTWGPDDNLYASWGDGGGFGGSDTDSRVAMGFARIEDMPEHWRGFNVNGGKSPEHTATFPRKGKTAGIAFVDGILYAIVNLQDGKWPEVNHVIEWSKNSGATWSKATWLFAKGTGNFAPSSILQFGKDYQGAPVSVAGFIYVYGGRHPAAGTQGTNLCLARVPKDKIRERGAWEFFQRLDASGNPIWVSSEAQAEPVFKDSNGVGIGSAVYAPALKRYLLTTFHSGPGQLGIFDAPNLWGPWTTVVYYEDWGKMGIKGEGLTCSFPQKWMSSDGLTLWSIFAVYGEGAKIGLKAHDRFNVVKTTIELHKSK